MNRVAYLLAIFAVVGVNILPANALEKEINTDTILTDATEQIKESTNPQGCYWTPWGWVC